MKSCKEWQGRIDRLGYGRRPGARGVTKLMHRVAWEEANGPIPKGMHVLHMCDNRKCYEVSHLWLGTHADNMADMARKGRVGSRKGEAHHAATITEEVAREIKWLLSGREFTARTIASAFGVSKDVVKNLQNGKTWRHV